MNNDTAVESGIGVGVGGNVVGVGAGGSGTVVAVGEDVTGVGAGGNTTGVDVGSGVGNTIGVGVGCCRLEVPPQAEIRQTTERRARLKGFPMESPLAVSSLRSEGSIT
ncbi:MAG: hypothetical protein O7E55_00790 [Chloroflexi bacterium]|nr:hypothetical protein [Chloroflexota bacterium]